jgi:hypothetical protein
LLLRQISHENSKWIFSFAGTLVNGQNLSLLNFLSTHQFEIAFNIFETSKLTQDAPMPMAEVSFICSSDLLEEFMKNPLLDFGWDFRLGGWLVGAAIIEDLLKEAKFRGQFYYPSTVADIGFCSSEDWDCVQFFSADETKMTTIQKLWAKELRKRQ